jgi:hypothetical protein
MTQEEIDAWDEKEELLVKGSFVVFSRRESEIPANVSNTRSYEDDESF